METTLHNAVPCPGCGTRLIGHTSTAQFGDEATATEKVYINVCLNCASVLLYRSIDGCMTVALLPDAMWLAMPTEARLALERMVAKIKRDITSQQ